VDHRRRAGPGREPQGDGEDVMVEVGVKQRSGSRPPSKRPSVSTGRSEMQSAPASRSDAFTAIVCARYARTSWATTSSDRKPSSFTSSPAKARRSYPTGAASPSRVSATFTRARAAGMAEPSTGRRKPAFNSSTSMSMCPRHWPIRSPWHSARPSCALRVAAARSVARLCAFTSASASCVAGPACAAATRSSG
jgi:hypothetical protein